MGENPKGPSYYVTGCEVHAWFEATSFRFDSGYPDYYGKLYSLSKLSIY